MNQLISKEKDLNRQLLHSSLQFGLLTSCLRLGWMACLVTFFTAVIWFSPTRFYIEGGGVLCLIAILIALRLLALPRVKTLDQLDVISSIVITPCWMLATVALYTNPEEHSLPTIVMLNAIAAILFYRDRSYWSWFGIMLGAYILCRYSADKPMTRFDWSSVLLLMPTLSVIFRTTVNASFRKLESQNRERSELVAELSGTIEQLRAQEQISRVSKLEVQANDAQLNAIIGSAPLFLFVANEDDLITELRGSVIQIKLGDPLQYIGQHYSKVFEQLPNIAKLIEDTRKYRRARTERLTCADSGNIFEVKLELIRKDDDSHEIIGVGFDVTESAAADQQRLELQQSLFHSQKMESLGLLAGGVAHDFNNYLMAIVAFAESLPANEFGGDSASKIINTAMQASGVCEQLLVYSGKGSTQENKAVCIKLDKLVKDIQPLIQAIVPKYIELEFDFQNSSSTVNVIPGQIHQVMINMIKNSVEAIQESGEGKISVRVSEQFQKTGEAQFFGELIPDRSYCQIEVADNGIGIEAEDLSRIADLYFSTKSDGHGFGMAVAARLVQDHSGCIEVEGLPSLGTIVRVVLPTHTKHATDSPPSPTSVPQPHFRKNIKGYPVLLVDDELAVLEAVHLVLTSQGHTVTAVSSPLEALEILKQNGSDFACVVSDYSMPQMNGLKLGSEIRRANLNHPFVLCSGYVLPADTSANDFVSDAVLVKPYKPRVLDEIIRRICSQIENPLEVDADARASTASISS